MSDTLLIIRKPTTMREMGKSSDCGRVLLTGGAGYVGSRVLSLLLSHGHEVVVVDNLLYGGAALLPNWDHPGFSFIRADITDAAALERIFFHGKFWAVVHLAALVGDPACARQPERARTINLTGSSHLLAAAQAHKVERFIFTSTCSNYGKMSASDAYVNEQSLLAPVSFYAELKVQFEQQLLNTPRSRGWVPTVFRCATVYGVSSRMRFDLTVNEFTKELAFGRTLEVFGQQFWRPYCHVEDIASAIALVLGSSAEQVDHQVFNIGDTGENYQKQMIVEEIQKILPKAQIRFIHKDEDPRDYRVSFEKVKRVLGFQITKTVPEGIRDVLSLIQSGVILDPDDPKYKN